MWPFRWSSTVVLANKDFFITLMCLCTCALWFVCCMSPHFLFDTEENKTAWLTAYNTWWCAGHIAGEAGTSPPVTMSTQAAKVNHWLTFSPPSTCDPLFFFLLLHPAVLPSSLTLMNHPLHSYIYFFCSSRFHFINLLGQLLLSNCWTCAHLGVQCLASHHSNVTDSTVKYLLSITY